MGVVGVRSKREDGTAWGRPGGSRAEFTPEGLLDWQRCLNFPVSRKGKPVEGSTQGKRIPGTFYLDRWAALWRAGCELELSELVTKLRASEDRLAIPPKVKSAGEGGGAPLSSLPSAPLLRRRRVWTSCEGGELSSLESQGDTRISRVRSEDGALGGKAGRMLLRLEDRDVTVSQSLLSK